MFLLPDGSSLPEEEIERALMILDGVKEELATIKSRPSTETHIPDESSMYKSVFDMYRRRFEANFEGIRCDGDGKSNRSFLFEGILDWYRKFEIVDNACRDPEQLSIRLTMKMMMISIIIILIYVSCFIEYPNECYSSEVTEITWNVPAFIISTSKMDMNPLFGKLCNFYPKKLYVLTLQCRGFIGKVLTTRRSMLRWNLWTERCSLVITSF